MIVLGVAITAVAAFNTNSVGSVVMAFGAQCTLGHSVTDRLLKQLNATLERRAS